MRGRYPDEIVVEAEHIEVLQAVMRDGRVEQRVARRARMLLLRANGERVETVAERVDQDRSTVLRVCKRYVERGVEAIYDAPRSGRRRVFSPSGAGADRESGVQRSERVWAGGDALVGTHAEAGGGRAKDRHVDSLHQHRADLAASGVAAASVSLLEECDLG